MRNGKIARLPGTVREELDRRMAERTRTDEILAWLNGLPEVHARERMRRERQAQAERLASPAPAEPGPAVAGPETKAS